MVECALCGVEISGDKVYHGDVGTPYEDEPICWECYHSHSDGEEVCALVYYGSDREPYRITLMVNETYGDFRVRWVSIDPWRGYYEVSSSRYAKVHTAEILAYHRSQEVLKRFDKKVKEYFEEAGIDYAVVVSETSNVFYHNYDLFVKREHYRLASILVALAMAEVDYGNPEWWRDILFEEESLDMLARLFPERRIATDYDAFKLIEELGDSFLEELQERLRKSGD
jgi:hypothetical protein